MFSDVVYGLPTTEKEAELVREFVLTLDESVSQLVVTCYPVRGGRVMQAVRAGMGGGRRGWVYLD